MPSWLRLATTSSARFGAASPYLFVRKIPYVILVTYDPTRFSDNLPPNVDRYINLYQSSSVMGGGDVVQGRGFRGHYASFDLKDRRGMFHTNMEKFGDIHDQLVNKITALGATPVSSNRRGGTLRHPDRSAPRLGSQFAVRDQDTICRIKFN